MLGSSVIHSSETMRVDHFWNDDNKRQKLVFVFSARGNRTLYGNSFGGDFLLMNGFDVVAFKSIADKWFQEAPEEVFAAIDRLAEEKGYALRAAMATSMGAYAALAFSKRLKCDLILAYSPQYSVLPDFDARFDADPAIDWRYVVSAETINRECKYVFVYDHRDFDRFHVRRLKELIPPENVEELRIPYAGHGIVTFLLELDLLKSTTLNLLLGRRLSTRELRKDRRRSTEYLITLSQALTARRKFRQLAAVSHISHLRLRERNFEARGHRAIAEQHQVLLDKFCRPSRLTAWGLRRRALPIHKLFEGLETMRLRRLGFDEIFYLKTHSDVLQLGVSPVLHYIRHGREEGRAVRFRPSA